MGLVVLMAAEVVTVAVMAARAEWVEVRVVERAAEARAEAAAERVEGEGGRWR